MTPESPRCDPPINTVLEVMESRRRPNFGQTFDRTFEPARALAEIALLPEDWGTGPNTAGPGSLWGTGGTGKGWRHWRWLAARRTGGLGAQVHWKAPGRALGVCNSHKVAERTAVLRGTQSAGDWKRVWRTIMESLKS